MNEELRAQMVEEAVRLLREAITSGKAVIKGWPRLGDLEIDGLTEDVVKLFMAL